MSVLWIIVPGMAVGVALLEALRRSFFEEDKDLVRRLFESQPVTMVAATTIVGSILVWGVLELLGL